MHPSLSTCAAHSGDDDDDDADDDDADADDFVNDANFSPPTAELPCSHTTPTDTVASARRRLTTESAPALWHQSSCCDSSLK